MWLLSQFSSQHCGVYPYILAIAESSSLSIVANRHRPFCLHSCLDTASIPSAQLSSTHAHNLNNPCLTMP
jgi:hypothetical protein